MQVVPSAAQQNPRYQVTADNVTRFINANGLVAPNGNQIILSQTAGVFANSVYFQAGTGNSIVFQDGAGGSIQMSGGSGTISLLPNTNLVLDPLGYLFARSDEPVWVASTAAVAGAGVGALAGNAQAGILTAWDGNAYTVTLPGAISGASLVVQVTSANALAAGAQPYIGATAANSFTLNSVTPIAGMDIHYRVVQI